MFAKSFVRAFDNWWSIFGILTSALAIFNILTRSRAIDLSALMKSILEAYRTIFHKPIDFAAAQMHIHIEPWLKDPLVLWFVLAMAVYRLSMQITNSARANKGDLDVKFFPGFGSLSHLPSLLRAPVVLLLSIVLWPYILMCFLLEPKVHKYSSDDGEPFGLSTFGFNISNDARYEFLYDTRIVFMVQMLAAALAMGGFVALNALTTVQ